jgi:hypothetical protein
MMCDLQARHDDVVIKQLLGLGFGPFGVVNIHWAYQMTLQDHYFTTVGFVSP